MAGVLIGVSSSGYPRLLVLRGGALGDFIVTLPVLAALRKRWPSAYIELVGYPYLAEIAKVVGLVDHLASLHNARIARFFALRPHLPDDQRAYIRSFDIVFCFFHDPDETVRGNLETAGARQVIVGSPLVKELHAVDHLLKPLEGLAIYEGGAMPILNLPAAECVAGHARLAALLSSPTPNPKPRSPWILHPGSGSPKKNWPLGHYIELARRMRDGRNFAPVFLLGEAEDDAREGLTRNAPDIPRLDGLSVREAAQILAAADGYIGNDSGISHLAAAVGARAIALFGPSRADLWSPRGPRVTVLQAPDGVLDQLSIDTVIEALNRS